MAFKRIKDWLTTITAFRTGDVIPVDGPSGTAKMSKDDLLRVTAENALAGNVATAFDATRTSENPYIAGKDVVEYNGKLYTFKTDHYGAWDSTNVEQVASDWSSRKTEDYSDSVLVGYYVNTNVAVGDSVSIAFTKDSGWSCAVIPCKAGDVFAVIGTGGTNPRLWAVLDSDGKLIAVSNAGVSTSKKIFVTAAVDGSFIYNTSVNAVVKTCVQYQRFCNFSDSVGEGIVGEVEVAKIGGSIGCGDEGETILPIVTPNSSWLCSVEDCNAGEVFRIAGRGGSSSRLWCVIDSDGKVIVTAPANTYKDSVFNLTIPVNGRIIYNTLKTAPTQLFNKVSVLKGLVLPELSALSKKVEKGAYYYQAQDLVIGSFVNTAGDMGDELTLEFSANTSWESCIIPCEKGDAFEIAGRGGNGARLWCFVDSDNKIINNSNANLTISDSVTMVASVKGKFIYNTLKTASLIVCKKRVFTPEAIQHIVDTAYTGETPKMADIGVKLETNDVSGELENFTLFDGSDNPVMGQIYAYLDAVVSEHPSLISKVDAAEEMGIEYPAYASDYKTYLYKISNANTYVGNQDGAAFEKRKILLVAGTHGLEIAGCVNVAIFAKRLCDDILDDENLFKLLSAFDIYVLPCLNGYGIINHTYVNANGVNINRNYPTIGWTPSGSGTNYWSGDTAGSEFETQLVMALCESIWPSVAFDCHSYAGSAWQFYDTYTQPEIQNILYKILTECSYVFKKAYPQYFGTEYALLKDGGSDAPINYDKRPGLFSTWFPENYGGVGIVMEVSNNINYNGGVADPVSRDRYGSSVFAIADFTLRDHLGRLGEYVLKNDL